MFDFDKDYADCKNSLGCCIEAPTPMAKGYGKIKKEEIPMSSISTAISVLNEESIEAKQRRSLKDALYDAFRDKVAAAKKQFGLTADAAPETVKELIQRIKDGKFSIKPDREDDYASSFWYTVSWKDPSVTVDKDGYKAARAALDTEYNALDLRIAIIPVADALAAVETYRDGPAASPKAV